MRRVDDEPTTCGPEGLVRHAHQACVGRRPKGEAVVHRGRVRQHEPFAFGPVPRDRHAGREVQRLPQPELVERPRRPEVVQGLLHRHLPADLAGDLLTTPEQAPHLAGQHSTAAVVLERELPEVQTQPGGDRSVEDLLDLLQLDEVVARADGAEPHARQLLRHPRQLTADAFRTAVPVHVEAAALLDPLELLCIEPEPVDREGRPFLGAPEDVVGGQLERFLRRPRVPLTDPPVEVTDGLDAGPIDVERDQGHAAVHRAAGEGRANRVACRHGDARRHLHVFLVEEVGQHDGRGHQIGVSHARLQQGDQAFVCGRVVALEDPSGLRARGRSRRGCGRHRAGSLLILARAKASAGTCGVTTGASVRLVDSASLRTPPASSTEERRMVRSVERTTCTQGTRRVSVSETAQIGGCAGPRPVPAATVAAKGQYRRISPAM